MRLFADRLPGLRRRPGRRSISGQRRYAAGFGHRDGHHCPGCGPANRSGLFPGRLRRHRLRTPFRSCRRLGGYLCLLPPGPGIGSADVAPVSGHRDRSDWRKGNRGEYRRRANCDGTGNCSHRSLEPTVPVAARHRPAPGGHPPRGHPPAAASGTAALSPRRGRHRQPHLLPARRLRPDPGGQRQYGRGGGRPGSVWAKGRAGLHTGGLEPTGPAYSADGRRRVQRRIRRPLHLNARFPSHNRRGGGH